MENVKGAVRLITHPAPAYILLAAIYTVLVFTLPASRATMNAYDLSPVEYRIILLAVALPSLIVWLAAFLGYTKLKEYALAVQKTPEGPHFGQLSKGVSW